MTHECQVYVHCHDLCSNELLSLKTPFPSLSRNLGFSEIVHLCDCLFSCEITSSDMNSNNNQLSTYQNTAPISIVIVRENLAEEPEVIRREVIQNYAKGFPPIYLDVVQHSDLSTLTWAPLMFRYPWHVVLGNLGKQNITVAGDAMHPMTPDLGQGGCKALEDAVVLGRYIGTSFIQNGRLVPKEMDNVIGKCIEERRWHVTLLIAGPYLAGRASRQGPDGV